jgi:hypothetical protein
VENPEDATTSVLLIKPAAGEWKVTQGAGPVAPTTVQTAGYTAPPVFEGAVVSKSGGRKTLSMAYTVPGGATVSVVEEGNKVAGDIVSNLKGHPCGHGAPETASGSALQCATVNFTPTAGHGGKRDIFAVITHASGLPGTKVKIASYVAPPQASPSLPRGLWVRRTKSRTGVILSWRPSRPAASQTISVALSSGAKFGLETKRCSSVHVRGVPSKVAVDVRVAGVRTDMRVGPYARLRLASAKTRAGARGRLKRRTCLIDYDAGAR